MLERELKMPLPVPITVTGSVMSGLPMLLYELMVGFVELVVSLSVNVVVFGIRGGIALLARVSDETDIIVAIEYVV